MTVDTVPIAVADGATGLAMQDDRKLVQDATSAEPKAVRKRYNQMEKDYRDWHDIHYDQAQYLVLGRGRFPQKGERGHRNPKRSYKVINPAATKALQVFGAGLHGTLSNPARLWFRYGLLDRDKNHFFRNWLDEAERKAFAVLGMSNFYQVAHNGYEECGGFGHHTVGMMEHPEHIVHFVPYTAGETLIATDGHGMCHTMARKYEMQLYAMALEFGLENMSYQALQQLRTNPYDWRTVLHIVEPNHGRNDQYIDNRNMPVRSVHIEEGIDDRWLKFSGFHEMPVFSPRWYASTGDSYGWGPGLWALGLCKAVQKLEKNSFSIIEKLHEPPVGVPPSLTDQMLDLSPRGKTPITQEEFAGGAQIRPIIEIDPNALIAVENKILKVEDMLKELFFNDLFLMLAEDKTGQMTATEVLKRDEERVIMLGPSVQRLTHEFLDPMLTRLLNIMIRRGIVSPPPPEIMEEPYEIEYLSVLAQSQKIIMARSMDTYLAQHERVTQLDPRTVYKTDWNTYIDEWGDLIGVPGRIIRNTDEANAMADAAAQAEAQALQAQQMLQGAQTAKILSETNAQGNNALGELQRTIQ
jgi:hypothetical protein